MHDPFVKGFPFDLFNLIRRGDFTGLMGGSAVPKGLDANG
jgi:hypothetical protein